ncbi:MAG: hypothetical protein QOK17_592 [Sphingomonadales bacterium]|jgi:hypothetical protein|nr:hypothetical protein [Sphingomonadales bacterium]
MLPVPVFYGILLASCIYAAVRGAGPEKSVAAIYAVSAILSTALVSGRPARFGSVETGVFVVDMAMLIALAAIAFRANRFWPLWVTALQAVDTAGHTVKLIDPTVIRPAYAAILALWSYPMMLILVIGTWNHQKRLRLYGVDRSWSSFSGRLGLGRRRGPPG